MVIDALEEENDGKFQIASLHSVKYGNIVNFILKLYHQENSVFIKAGDSINVYLPQDFPRPYFNIGSITCFESIYSYEGYIYQKSNYINIRFTTDSAISDQLDLVGIFICQ